MYYMYHMIPSHRESAEWNIRRTLASGNDTEVHARSAKIGFICTESRRWMGYSPVLLVVRMLDRGRILDVQPQGNWLAFFSQYVHSNMDAYMHTSSTLCIYRVGQKK
jgi:hypothetical protein